MYEVDDNVDFGYVVDNDPDDYDPKIPYNRHRGKRGCTCNSHSVEMCPVCEDRSMVEEDPEESEWDD